MRIEGNQRFLLSGRGLRKNVANGEVAHGCWSDQDQRVYFA